MNESSFGGVPPLLEVDDLTKSFEVRTGWGRPDQAVQAVSRVSFDLGRGETVAIVGESGCGKTTTVRCIMGLVQPTAGDVRFEGRSLSGLSPSEWLPYRRRIQMVFQKPMASLNRKKTVGDILTMPLKVHDVGTRAERDEAIDEVLDAVGMTSTYRDRYPHELSGGQQQRVAIARALILRPELIVADEPVSSLDVSVQGKIINLLLDLQRDRNLTYLIIAHDLGVVNRMADRVVVMYLGEIVETGPTHEVLGNPKHPYTQALLTSVPKLGVRKTPGESLRGELPSPLSPPSGCRFHTRCPAYLGDICKTDSPEPTVLAEGGMVRCHLHRHDRRAGAMAPTVQSARRTS